MNARYSLLISIFSFLLALAALVLALEGRRKIPVGHEAESVMHAPSSTTSVSTSSQPNAGSLIDLSNAMVQVAKRVKPSVVSVFTERVWRERIRSPFSQFGFDDFFEGFGFFKRQPSQPEEREFRQRGLGSGVIVSADGYILTNNHVVQDADTISVGTLDNRKLTAKVIGKDPKTDLAVIKMDAKNLQPIERGDSDKLQVGEIVLAVGSPMSPGLAHTVTQGIVSAVGRSNVGLADFEDFIQTDAAINPGNSGGALVNLRGELVGINTAIATQSGGYQGIGFAVPIHMAAAVMDSLIANGKVARGWLGINVQELTEDLEKALKISTHQGVLVLTVIGGSPADKAGIQQGDLISEMNGKETHNVTQYRTELGVLKPGDELQLKLFRNGKEMKLSAKLTDMPNVESSEPSLGKNDKLSELWNRLGFRVTKPTTELLKKYHAATNEGVLVLEVGDDTQAQAAGLMEGDLILSVNKQPTPSLEEFLRQTKALRSGSSLLLEILRQRRSLYLAFSLE